jgi:hypothetical protein
MKAFLQRTAFSLILGLVLTCAVPAASGAESVLHRVVREGDCIRSLLLESNCVTSMSDYASLREAFGRHNPEIFHSELLEPGKPVSVPVLYRGSDPGCLTFRDQSVVRIGFEAEAVREKVYIHLDGPVLPDVFTLRKTLPVRVVCDFDGTLPEADLQRDMETDGRLIRRIRVGHEDKPFRRARVVLEVDETLSGRIEQEFFEQESLFVLTVHEIDTD